MIRIHRNHRARTFNFAALLLVALMTTLSGGSGATVPALINYQGYLTDAGNAPVTDPFKMSFALYSDSTGGTLLWSESYAAVDVTAGVFNVLLGTVTPFPANTFSGAKLWLQTTASDIDILPRRPIVSVAYALRAASAEGASMNQQVFSTPGTFAFMATFTGKHKITAVGGGGGGNGGTAKPGAGAGATAILWADLVAGTSYTVVVGGGGGGGSGNTGGTGGTSSFNTGVITASAGGGTNGGDGNGTPSGGTATNGTINDFGGDGSNGSNAGGSPYSGSGGASSFGSGGNGNNSARGANGRAYGSGGAGGVSTGGDGANGIVIVEW